MSGLDSVMRGLPQLRTSISSRPLERVALIASGFVLLSVVGYYGIACFKLAWTADFYRHAAAVRAFQLNLQHPAHEAMSGASSSVLHAPYHLLLGACARALSVSPYRVLQLAGVFNLCFFIAGITLFFRAYSPRAAWTLAPGLFVLLNLFFRERTFGWSSETDVFTLRYIQAYPSFFGWGAALVSFALARRFVLEGGRRRLGCVAFLLAFTLPSHPLTGGWMLGLLPAIGLSTWLFDGGSKRRFGVLVGAVVVALGAALAWPYPPGLRGLGGYSRFAEGALFAEHPFRDMPSVYAAGAVVFAWKIGRRESLVIPFLWGTTCLGLVASWLLGISYGARFVFFQLFLVHAGVAEGIATTLAEVGQRLRKRTSVLAPSLVLVLLVVLVLPVVRERLRNLDGLPSPSALLSEPSAHDAHYARFRALEGLVGPRAVVLTEPTPLAYALAEATGARVVLAPAAFDHPEYAERERVLALFTQTSSTAFRPVAALTPFGVTHVVLTQPEPALSSALLRSCGAPRLVSGDLEVHDLVRCANGHGG